jgi:hypothetical protein
MPLSATDLLADLFDHVRSTAHRAAEGLDADALNWRPAPDANHIGWLVWHLARVQDDHVAAVAGTEQEYATGGWADRFGLPFEPGAIGYGMSSEDVARVRITDPELLLGYVDAVLDTTGRFLHTLTAEDLDRVVDRNWNPPVTLGVRLTSVANDDLQHGGQAAYVRGLLP